MTPALASLRVSFYHYTETLGASTLENKGYFGLRFLRFQLEPSGPTALGLWRGCGWLWQGAPGGAVAGLLSRKERPGGIWATISPRLCPVT